MSTHRSFVAAATTFVFLALPLAAHAQRLDIPALTVVDQSAVTLDLEVRAGASGAPNGFVIEWMSKTNFDLEGGWPADPVGTGLYYCTFDGLPTNNIWLDGADYILAPFESAIVVVGDLFDETGVTTDYFADLMQNEEYVFRAYAAAPLEEEESYYSPTRQGETISKEECIHSQGYWKNHSSEWPVNSLTLGSVSYTKAQLLSILNTAAGGNGLIILAKQLIAAKLNILNGGDPAPIQSWVAAADAMIGSLVVPPVGSGFLSPSSVNSIKNKLDDYNTGKTYAECGFTSDIRPTWGEVKVRYR